MQLDLYFHELQGVIKYFIDKDNRSVESKKFITVDFNKSMYDAYRILSNKNITFLPVKKGKNIVSYLSLHEIMETLSPERLNIDKKQFETAVKKFVPKVTSKTLNRIIMLTLMGPIFGWFLLASFILKVSLIICIFYKDVYSVNHG